MSLIDRNIIKLNTALDAHEEFGQRADLIMMCIERFIEKIKIDLTVRFTKHIQLDHFAIMDKIFRSVDSFYIEGLKSGEHAEFEWQKEWRHYEQQQAREAERIAKEEEERRIEEQLAACEALAPVEEEL